jgi:hypothetical protein
MRKTEERKELDGQKRERNEKDRREKGIRKTEERKK